MQDPDDYDIDDIVLDEQALAFLDQQERGYVNQTYGGTERPPPLKRQKIEGGLVSEIVRTASVDDLEDLPEISIRDDGTYALCGSSPSVRTPTSTLDNPFEAAPSGASARIKHVPMQNTPRGSPIRRQSPGSTIRRVQPRQVTQRQLQQSAVESQSLTNSQGNELQAKELRHQLEELRNENMKIRADLQEALDVRFTREGEVTILRNGMEKTAQEHAAQIAKLKAAKEEADAKQAQIQKEMKDEMERLRTQFVFKQHEIETSSIKPPWSTRGKRVGREAPSTPLPLPSQMAGWNQGYLRSTGPSRYAGDTPHQFGKNVKMSPKLQRTRKQPISPSTGKSTMLPGFHNAFVSSSPVRPEKGKARDMEGNGKGRDDSLFGFQPQFTSTFRPGRSPSSSPTPSKPPTDRLESRSYNLVREDDSQVFDTLGVDFPDGNAEMLGGENGSEQFCGIEPLNWKEELHQIILTHSQPPSVTMTFQILMSVSLPSGFPAQSVDAYSTACTNILEILAAASEFHDWISTVHAVSSALIQIAQVLVITDSIVPLTALLNLMSHLIFSLPSFGSALLSELYTEDQHKEISSPMLLILRDIIRDHLTPQKQGDEQVHLKSLAKETFGLLEALCWNASNELAGRLASILLSDDILPIILNTSQPSWVLSRSTRLLVFLATHADPLCQSLTLVPDQEGQQINNDTSGNLKKILQLLCPLLIATERHGEAESMKISILTFIAVLAVSQADALPILLESQTLIPSLVLSLSHLTIPIWEDDEALMVSPTTVTSTIRTLNQTLFLLHHLVFSAEPAFNLRHKLHHAPHRQLNGITHIFIVTLGRLSYADPPDWMVASEKSELEYMAGMARDLLELVVEGPEGDSIWAVYQGTSEHGSDVDEEMDLLMNVDND